MIDTLTRSLIHSNKHRPIVYGGSVSKSIYYNLFERVLCSLLSSRRSLYQNSIRQILFGIATVMATTGIGTTGTITGIQSLCVCFLDLG